MRCGRQAFMGTMIRDVNRPDTQELFDRLDAVKLRDIVPVTFDNNTKRPLWDVFSRCRCGSGLFERSQLLTSERPSALSAGGLSTWEER